MYKFTTGYIWPGHGRWDLINFHGAGTFVGPIQYKSRLKHQNMLGGQCVYPWWPLQWLSIRCPKEHIPYINMSTEGEGMPGGGLPFLPVDCPVPYFGNISWYGMINVWDTVSIFIHPLDCCRPRTSFTNNGMASYDRYHAYQICKVIKDNQQEGSRFSKWLFLQWLGRG